MVLTQGMFHDNVKCPTRSREFPPRQGLTKTDMEENIRGQGRDDLLRLHSRQFLVTVNFEHYDG